uniref:START domain-containing protein n=1 Tax=Tetraselmis chuii TaxID=63592 RepID=A0A7S1SJP9_9CHLO
MVSQMINARYMQLWEDCILQHKTKAHVTDSAKSPRTFHLDGTCTVSIVYEEDMLLKPKGVGTVQALVMSNYEHKQLHVFTIRWALAHGHYGRTDHLLLGFSDKADAVKWREAVQRCIEKLPARKTPRDGLQKDSSGVSSSLEFQRESSERGMSTSSETQQPMLVGRGGDEEEDDDDDDDFVDASQNLEKSSPGGKEGDKCNYIDPEWMRKAQWPTKWVSQSFYNGIAVYREQEKDGGAHMCHAVIRSSPKEVFEAVQRFEVGFNSTLQNMTVLETFKGENTQIVHCNITPQGALVPFFGPRDLVIQRSWRVEEDETYVVTMNSVEHPLCPTPPVKKGLGWFTSPVRAQVIAAGFSIAPLKAKHLPPSVNPSQSPECLLTVVMRVDIGGALNWFGPAFRSLENMWLEPMISSIAGIRERMEQRRFVGTCLLADADSAKSSHHTQQQAHQPESTAVKPSQSPLRSKSTSQSGGSSSEFNSSHLVLDQTYWSYPGIAGMKVRGPGYLQTKKKVLSQEPMFTLTDLFLLKLDKATENIAHYLLPPSTPGFTFVVNIMVPGDDKRGHTHLVVFWNDTRGMGEEEDDESTNTPFNTSLARFIFGDGPTFDAQRNSTFKLIPHVVDGSWVIKQSVGATPVLLGNKLRQAYHRGPNYFEVDIDIASSAVARNVVGLVEKSTRTVVVDLAILMEGKKEDELPERLLGTVQLNRIDMDKATRLTQADLNQIGPRSKKTE